MESNISTLWGEEEFYLTLSSAVEVAYKDNKAGDFVTPFPFPITLPDSDEWYVSLSSISYPCTWQNLYGEERDDFGTLKDNEIEITLDYMEGGMSEETKKNLPYPQFKVKFTVPPDNYTDVEKLIQAINSAWKLYLNFDEYDVIKYNPWIINLSDYQKEIVLYESTRQTGLVEMRKGDLKTSHLSFLSFDKETEKVTLKHAYPLLNIRLSPRLSSLLGFGISGEQSLSLHEPFEGEDKESITEKHTAKYSPDLTGQEAFFLVYTDIIQSQIVANTLAQVLSVVQADRPPNVPYVQKNFIKEEFVKVKTTTFDRISIQIRSLSGPIINFRTGKVVLHLHFKKKHPLLPL